MKKILRKITKSFSARSEEPIPVFDITGCVPMSFGVMFKCVALTDVTVKGNMTILLVNGQEKMETQIINAEKESVVSIYETTFMKGETGTLTLEYSERIMTFPLRGVRIYLP